MRAAAALAESISPTRDGHFGLYLIDHQSGCEPELTAISRDEQERRDRKKPVENCALDPARPA